MFEGRYVVATRRPDGDAGAKAIERARRAEEVRRRRHQQEPLEPWFATRGHVFTGNRHAASAGEHEEERRPNRMAHAHAGQAWLRNVREGKAEPPRPGFQLGGSGRRRHQARRRRRGDQAAFRRERLQEAEMPPRIAPAAHRALTPGGAPRYPRTEAIAARFSRRLVMNVRLRLGRLRTQ